MNEILAALPPWGQMDADLLSDMRAEPIPRDWKPFDGSARDPVGWQKWLNGIVDQIGDMLWPAYASGSSNWETSHVRDLFNADFELLERLGLQFEQPIKALHTTTVTHSDMFLEEDNERIGFGSGYERYDPQLARAQRDRFRDVVHAGFMNKVATLDLQLKQVFQRPRAYQVAVLQNRRNFHHRLAVTANTPSLISGHCLEAAMGGCNAFVELSPSMNQDSISTLQQFTVDIGDRRVFAGVHYPSDSLASFFVALKLIPCVFEQAAAPKVKSFLWEAITSRSVCFSVMREHVAANENSPYRRTMQAIEQEARS